jgi:branched-chain amino acid transport system ATP-binding protein
MLLELEDVQTYYGLSHVLHGVQLTVGEGEVVALVGRNGAGKTTTLRSIIGLTPPAGGEIRFRGRRISGLKPHRIARRGLAYVPENREVFSYLTVQENLMLAHNPDSRWDLERVLTWFPALRPLMDRRGSQLSGGQQQMMVIGRGLLTGPDLLLLDEASQGLAPVIVKNVLEMLHNLKAEKLSVLLVEQSIKVAMELADRIYVLNNGRIAFEARASDLAGNPQVIERHMGFTAA